MTHTFEFKINSIHVEGEVDFACGADPQIKTNNGMELPLSELNCIQELFELFSNIYNKCDDITKIEVNKI